MRDYPASENELRQSLKAAKLISQQEGFALSSVICCSGNGHYVLAPLVPVPVDSDEVATKLKRFCQMTAEKISGQVSGVKIDPVYNLSRVMRLMGTINGKGKVIHGRSHRRAHFVTEPASGRSMALRHMILNTEVKQPHRTIDILPKAIRCDLSKLEKCKFIQWCRKCPEFAGEPLWFAMITNLAHLEGGPELIHEISALDKFRYDYSNTQRIIERVIETGYKPVSCETLTRTSLTHPERGRFNCSKIEQCQAKAPMYLATLYTVYKR